MPTSSSSRHSTGVPGLDERLGGGLIPGTLTVAVGATGIGKTQLGLQYAEAGLATEGQRGLIFDMTSRGDSQSHADYAQRLFGRQLVPATQQPDMEDFFAAGREYGNYLHVFDQSGRRVSRSDLDFEAWRAWKTELVEKLSATIAFFYGNFVSGARRAVIDGIEPVGRAGDSIQLELFEYVYHQILRKDPEWVARDLFRQAYRRHAAEAAARLYDPAQVSCLMLYTSSSSLLDALIEEPLGEGDVLTNANTVIYLGKIRDGARLTRALHIAKHRGSAASDEILPYEITNSGLRLLV